MLRGLTADGDVADFLGKEILDVLELAQRSFLLDTCVLERLCGPLCEAVAEDPSAGESLRTAVRDGLFLVPLDHRRTWYRYHQLFRDILCRRLRAEAPGRESGLHRRAARWWMSQDDPHAAAAHAMLAGAGDLLGELIERWGMSLIYSSDRQTIERWLGALPDGGFDSYPMAGTLAGWLAVLPLRRQPLTADALAAVARARGALAAAELPPGRRAEIDGHLVAIEAIATRPVADLPGCIAHAEAALRTLDRARGPRLIRPFIESRARIAAIVGNLADRDRQFLTSAVTAPAPPPVARATPAPPRRSGLAPLAEPLSPRELEVLGLVRQGKSNADIARALFVSTGTIKTHMHRLMTKMGARNRVEAIRLAEDHGLLPEA